MVVDMEEDMDEDMDEDLMDIQEVYEDMEVHEVLVQEDVQEVIQVLEDEVDANL
jgi:hypothetical protein